MTIKSFFVFILTGFILLELNAQVAKKPTNKVVLSSDIEWEQLNPARGDKSPQAGTIWGDRKGSVATGFLVKFVDGFSSPSHIHNVTYRAMVINGLIHNDDPAAEKMWMGKGSFWTQPAGQSHITAAKGDHNLIYVEIDNGPYLVKPIEESFENGEFPVNVAQNNIVWLDASKTQIIQTADAQNGPKVAFLWEDDEMNGTLVKLPPKFKGKIHSDGEVLHAVIISGETTYKVPGNKKSATLDPGSYFTSKGKSIHEISNNQEAVNTIYVRTNGEISIVSQEGK